MATSELRTTSNVRTTGGLRRRNNIVAGYLFISPFILGFLVFTLFPTLASLFLSFTDYTMLGAPHWIGFQNYANLFTNDPKFADSLRVTAMYVIGSVPMRLVSALIVAMILHKLTRGSAFFRTVFYLPSIIGGSVAVAVMWKELFGDKGAINAILGHLGIHSVDWIGNPSTSLWTLVLLAGWQFGSPMLIFLAGLKNIPTDFYEAAGVDGASPVQQFFRITLPLLTPVILFNLIMQMISAFLAFTPSYIISNGTGNPLDSTLLYVLYMFQNAFQYFKMGYATAMAWIMLIIVAIFTALIFRSSSHWVHYESEED